MPKTVIVTGAAGNLGTAVVDKFLAEGYYVLATVEPGTRHPFDPALTQLEIHEVDIADESATRQFVQSAYEVHKNIQATVLLVGGFAMGSIAETGLYELEKMFRLNFFTAYNVARPSFLRMQWQPEGGRVVLIGARPAIDPADGKGKMAYALSKSLLFTLSQLLNAAGEDKNVRSTVIVPSIIDTPANRSAMPGADFSTWVQAEELAARIEEASRTDSFPDEKVVKVYGGA